MPRDSGGIYTLPAGNPVVSGTVIASGWANPTMDDLAAAMTDSLSRTGNGAMQSVLRLTDGAVSAPSLTFNNDPLSGRYLAAVGDMRDTVGGIDQVRYTDAGLSVTDGEGGWVPVLGSGSGAILVQTDFTDVAGQTVFTTELANSSADCFINGSLLANDDYTFTLGNTITLAEPVKNASDVVSILGYGAFDITDPAGAREQLDVYSKAETDNGRKNYLINGDMKVLQRVGPFANISRGTYTLDRWVAKTNSTDVTQSDGYLEDGRKVVTLRMDRTASSTQRRISQLIEIDPTYPESTFHTGESYKLSFYMWTDMGDGATPTPLLEARFVTDIDDGAASSCTISNITSEPFVGQFGLVTADITIDGDTTGKLALEVSIGVTYGSAQAIGTITRFALAQLETGSVATPFEYVSAGDNLAACQRYYWRGGLNGNGFGHHYATAGQIGMDGGQVSFPSEMRVDPTVNIVTPPTYVNCSNGNLLSTDAGMVLQVDVTATGKYRAYDGIYTANAEL